MIIFSGIRSPELTKAGLAKFIENEPDHDTLISVALSRISNSSLKNVEIEQLLKKIKEKTGTSLKSLKADIKDTNDKEDSSDLDYAREVILTYNPTNIFHSDGRFFIWRGKGVWEAVEDQTIKKKVHNVLEQSEAKSDISSHKVNSVIDLIRTESYKEEAFFSGRADIINVQNGELHFIDNEWILKEHDRGNYLISQLPIVFDVNAKAPRFLQFLNEVFQGDKDATEKKQALLQMFGYSLLQNCRYESFVMLIGSGANGKSVLLEVLRSLVGGESASAVQPNQFDNKFQRGHLEGKLVNIVTEIAEGHEVKDAELKSIVSGELTTAERKFKPPFEFMPFATCWFGTNHMPHTRDFSDALFRRAMILTFNQSFYGNRRDPNLKEKLLSELPGILSLALNGLTELMTAGAFVAPESSEEAKRLWRMEADQVSQFIDECCELSSYSQETSKDLYKAYQSWACESGINRKLNQNNFTKRLEKLGCARKKGAKGTRYISGIRVIKSHAFSHSTYS